MKRPVHLLPGDYRLEHAPDAARRAVPSNHEDRMQHVYCDAAPAVHAVHARADGSFKCSEADCVLNKREDGDGCE